MAWTKPRYTIADIDSIGRFLAAAVARELVPSMEEFTGALKVLHNWRRAHGYPQYVLRGLLAQSVAPFTGSLVAARLKRQESVIRKLAAKRHVSLSDIQDLGGCRAIVSRMCDLRSLDQSVRSACGKHDLIRVDDYVADPKWTGYRSIHHVYRYCGQLKSPYRGMFIEVQLRTALQHAFATAVEIASTFLDEPLKFGKGNKRRLRFFSLVGAAFATEEAQPAPHGVPKDPEALRAAIVAAEQGLQVRSLLQAWSGSVQHAIMTPKPLPRNSHYFVLQFVHSQRLLNIWAYPFGKRARAANLLERLEGESGADVVLVTVSALKDLAKTYPNYWGDTDMFIQHLKRVMAVDDGVGARA